MANFNMCVCGGGGGEGGGGRRLFYVVVLYDANFSNSESNTRSVSCQNKQNMEKYFHRQHFQREYFHIAY